MLILRFASGFAPRHHLAHNLLMQRKSGGPKTRRSISTDTQAGKFNLCRTFELALAGDALEGFFLAFDAILAIVAIVGQLTDDFIQTFRRGTSHIAGDEKDGFSNIVLMHFQLPPYATGLDALTVNRAGTRILRSVFTGGPD